MRALFSICEAMRYVRADGSNNTPEVLEITLGGIISSLNAQNISFKKIKNMPGFISSNWWLEFEDECLFNSTDRIGKILCPVSIKDSWMSMVRSLSSYLIQVSIINDDGTLTPYEEELHASLI